MADDVGVDAGAVEGDGAPAASVVWPTTPGVVLRDLIVSIADGGDCLADLGALRDQAELFGRVAS